MYSNTNLINATGKYLFNKHIYLKVRTALSRHRSRYVLFVSRERSPGWQKSCHKKNCWEKLVLNLFLAGKNKGEHEFWLASLSVKFAACWQ